VRGVGFEPMSVKRLKVLGWKGNGLKPVCVCEGVGLIRNGPFANKPVRRLHSHFPE
jgi:hypothetical protein